MAAATQQRLWSTSRGRLRGLDRNARWVQGPFSIPNPKALKGFTRLARPTEGDEFYRACDSKFSKNVRSTARYDPIWLSHVKGIPRLWLIGLSQILQDFTDLTCRPQRDRILPVELGVIPIHFCKCKNLADDLLGRFVRFLDHQLNRLRNV